MFAVHFKLFEFELSGLLCLMHSLRSQVDNKHLADHHHLKVQQSTEYLLINFKDINECIGTKRKKKKKEKSQSLI